MRLQEKVKVCPRCSGTGFVSTRYTGRCINKKRHVYTLPNGKRSVTCLVCGFKRGGGL